MKTSKKLFEEANKRLVGGVNSPVRSFKGLNMPPIFIKSAKGAYLISEDNQKFIDYALSFGPLLLGHSNPIIINEITKQLKKGTSFGAPTKSETDLAELVISFFPSIEKIRFVNSGTEACMSAIRLARGCTNRKIIIKFNGCYHGHVDSLLVKAGSGALTLGSPDSKGVIPEFTKNTLILEFNDTNSLKKAFEKHGNDIAGVILEPICGNMGVILPDTSFLKTLRSLCTKNKSLLIFDEVMTGFRINSGSAQAHYNIRPDLTCLGKVIGGGLPCGAFGGKKKYMDKLSPLGDIYQAGTLSGNPLVTSAGIKTLSLLKENPSILTNCIEYTTELVSQLKPLFKTADINCTFNHVGTMFSFFFTKNPVKNFNDVKNSNTQKFNKLYKSLLSEGIYLAPSPFESNFVSSCHTSKELKKTIVSFKKSLK